LSDEPARDGDPRLQVAAALEASLRAAGVFDPAASVLLAASGGRDSAGLLAGFAALAPWLRPAAVAVYVEHGLAAGRAGAGAAALAQARALGLPGLRRGLAAEDCRGLRPGSEAWARAGRYGALRRVAAELGAVAVVTAQHRDDRVETLLLRLRRGAGLRGLAGLAARRELEPGLSLLRPLLELPRQTLALAAQAAGLAALVKEDPSNGDRSFERNRVRHDLIPALGARLGEGGAGLLAEVAALFGALGECEAALVELAAARWLRGGRVLTLDAAGLQAAPGWLRRALLLEALHRLDREREPRRVHLVALERLALGSGRRDSHGARPRWCLPGGGLAWRDGAALRLRPGAGGGRPSLPLPPRCGAARELAGPGLYPVPELGAWLEVRPARASAATACRAGARQIFLPRAQCPFPWYLGPPAPGQTVLAFGEQRPRSLRGLLSAHGVAPERRGSWPLLSGAQGPLWLLGLRRTATAALPEQAVPAWRVRLRRRVPAGAKKRRLQRLCGARGCVRLPPRLHREAAKRWGRGRWAPPWKGWVRR